MNIVNVPIGDIKPYTGNPKKHPSEQVEQIANSIGKFGFVQPCVIDGDGNLIIGHGRVRAAGILGMDVVPCVRLEDISGGDLRMLRLIDNQLNMNSGWDMDLLKIELDDLDFDFEAWGFNFESTDLDMSDFEAGEDSGNTAKDLIKCPECGHVNEKRVFARYG